MLVLWLGLVSLTSSSALHQALHPDSHQPTHECLVTCLAKGQLLFLATVLLATTGLASEWVPAVAEPNEPFSRFDVRLEPSRAPPVHFCSDSVRQSA